MYRYVGRLSTYMNFCTLSNQVFGIASKMGGESKDSLYNIYAGNFHNQDLSKLKKSLDIKNKLPGVNIITTQEQCKRCVDILMKSNGIAAWDTQTMDLDIKQEAPVGKGKIICASFFAGPEFNFGRGPRVFIDNFGTNAGLLNHFKPYLQSENHKKVWHNYGFDRHVFYNHGIDVKGFGGDTMHMARLLDSSKQFGKYSLSELTSEYKSSIQTEASKKIWESQLSKLEKILTKSQVKGKSKQNIEQLQNRIQNIKNYLNTYRKSFQVKKTKMELLFGRKRLLKNGGQGVSYEYPTTLTLHTNEKYLQKWIQYSVLDSEATYFLRTTLMQKLKKQKIKIQERKQLKNLWEFYQKYWLPFGQVLTNMERQGIEVDIEHMNSMEQRAKQDLKEKEEKFLNFITKYQEGRNVDHFNPASTLQLQQLLFAPCEIKHQLSKQKKKELQNEKSRTQEDKGIMDSLKQEELIKAEKSKGQGQAYEVKAKGTRKNLELNQFVKSFKVQNKYYHSSPNSSKHVLMDIKGYGLPYSATTPTGTPAVDLSVLEELAGDPQKGKYGKAYDQLKDLNKKSKGKEWEEQAKELCVALKTLVEYSMNQTLLKTFIEPLKGYVDENNRVHCSLNINTETGRLSARKPNLQNQPALDKDVYKIRKAFIAGKGKKLIVADYGQLQLRVLAHLTNCQAMITAFKQGGDFHSRTAIGMYDYIKKDLQEGKILLEWDKSKGEPPVPLLKEKYAAERKKAKTVNFSIAYGKSAIGFAEDWGCSKQQAQQIINRWFQQRKEVKKWQEEKKNIASGKLKKQKETQIKALKKTQTLLGRVRKLDKFFPNEKEKKHLNSDILKKLSGMGNRRAINTPIQGGAADIVNASMVKIAQNRELKELGWKLLMQIHDELILEGPEESSKQAFEIVKNNMENPFDFKLRVDLEVDAKIGDNWYECK